MRALNGESLLRAWEAGRTASELKRPLALLAVALPDSDPEKLEHLTLAERNRLLLDLHELTFGPLLEAVAECPKCSEYLEFSVPVAQAAVLTRESSDHAGVRWTEAGAEFALRPATTADLAATLLVDEEAAAEALLLQRCLVSAPERSAIPASVRERFDELHAAAELTCAIECPRCGAQESMDVDIPRFVWIELRRAATQLLTDVNELAIRYGWSERSILQMTSQRRDAYLELAAS